MSSLTHGTDSDRPNHGVKKSTTRAPAATTELSSGNIATRASRLVPAPARCPSPGLAERARPTGSPSASPSGVTADRTVACAAPTQNNVLRYAARAPHVATTRLPTPRAAYTAVRHQGQETPRRRAVTTPAA